MFFKLNLVLIILPTLIACKGPQDEILSSNDLTIAFAISPTYMGANLVFPPPTNGKNGEN